MMPIDIAFNFLKSELLESILDRMEGEEIDLGKIGQDEEMRNWNRFIHSNKRHIPEEERKWPSLRHVREKKEIDEQDIRDDIFAEEERAYEDSIARRNYEDELRYRETPQEQIQDALVRFKTSDRGQRMREELEDRLKQKHISQLVGVEPPQNKPFSLREIGQGQGATTLEDKLLLDALRTGDTAQLDRYQIRRENPFVGDMSLQQFEQTYPTETPVQHDLPSSVDNEGIFQDEIRNLPDEFDSLDEAPIRPLSQTEEETREFMQNLFG